VNSIAGKVFNRIPEQIKKEERESKFKKDLKAVRGGGVIKDLGLHVIAFDLILVSTFILIS